MKTYKSKADKYLQGESTLGDVLLKMTSLKLEILQDAARKGAVWLQRGKGKTLKQRSLKTKLSPEDTISFFYEPKILSLSELKEAQCLFENEHYGIWLKEAGVVPQGTQSADHTSLLRYIELQKRKDIFLIHRLDRETRGLMIVGYHSRAAAELSILFQKNAVEKTYQAIVLGSLPKGSKATINVSLDDKEAVTHYEVLDSSENRSLLSLKIETGRLHQIRRHLEHIGHPVMGDPKYGRGNKNRDGLQLLAKSLAFLDPWERVRKSWDYPFELSL